MNVLKNMFGNRPIYFDPYFSLPTGYRFLLRDIIRFINNIDAYAKSDGDRLLDVGCGTMPYRRLFNKYRYLGMDNFSEKQAKPHIKGDVANIPLDKNSVDAVMSVWLLDDIFDLDNALSEISRVIKPNGYYFAVENQATFIHNPPSDYFRLAPNAMIKLCIGHGLKLIQLESFAGDFANIGFSIIIACRCFFGLFKIERVMRPLYSLLANIVFAPLDKIFRAKCFQNRFEINALGHMYIFKKAS